MPLLAAFSAEYCGAEAIVDQAIARLGLRSIDEQVMQEAASRYHLSSRDLQRSLQGPAFAFNRFSKKREKHLAALKVTLSQLLSQDDAALHGFLVHLVPRHISHMLWVCLVADLDHRIGVAQRDYSSPRDARKRIQESDDERQQWTRFLFQRSAWDRSLYDLKIPTNQVSTEEAVQLVCDSFRREVLQPTDASRQAVRDFQVAARAEHALVEEGMTHAVAAHEGVVTVTVDEYVLRLKQLEDDIRRVLRSVPDIKQVEVRTGPNYRPTSVFAHVDLELPQKVLLVDDERDFVLTLSERLEMRDLEPAVAYDGEQALALLDDEEPDVMVLDLKMPGIDGIEVLRRVKVDHPEVEVIILTGHGDEKDRQLCLQLGAFAYLEKPVDIEKLSETMRQAKQKIRERTPEVKD